MPTSLDHLEWPALRERVAALCACPATRQRAEARDDPLLTRSLDVDAVRRFGLELDGLEAAARGTSAKPPKLRATLGDVRDIAPLVDRAAKGSVLELPELVAIADTTGAALLLHRWLAAEREGADETSRESIEAFCTRVEGIAPPHELSEALGRSLERDGDPRLRDEASVALAGLRKRVSSARRELTVAADRLLRKPQVAKALADNYWTEREGRVVLPVRSDAFSRAGGSGTVSGIIHGSSASGRTLFVEPHGLVDLANALREATLAERGEERRIQGALSRDVGDAAHSLRATLRALIELDAASARLAVSQAMDGVKPRVAAAGPGALLRAPGARHPLMVLRGDDVVASDLQVRCGSALVVSGPNAGGKTVALKTLGLFALMAACGLRLPTSAPADVPLYASIVTDVGDDQSIAGGLSTFSAHVGHLKDALDAAQRDGDRTLVLLDEVAVGTDPDQGAALAEAILETLVHSGATVVATTHYERLKLLAVRRPDAYTNAAVGFDVEAMRPTFRVTFGSPGSSSALTVARRLGLSEAVVDKAGALLGEGRAKVDALLRAVEAEREALAQERESMASARLDLEAAQRKLEASQRKELETSAHRRAKAHAAAAAQLRALEDELRERRKALRKKPVHVDTKSGVSDPAERGLAKDAKEKLAAGRPSEGDEGEPPGVVAVGDRVHVATLGADGDVLAVNGDRVTVQLPLAKTTVSIEALRPRVRKTAKTREPRRPSSTGSSAPKHFGADARPVDAGLDDVVDVRGARADEVLTLVEVFLDRAIASDRDVVIVRHGHGSGALRNVVREHLPRLAHVVRHRPGLPAEGGDAVTVVWVRS